MQQFLNNGVLTFFIIVALLGFAGGIVFFPVNIGDRYTCFFHRYVAGDTPNTSTHRVMPGQHGHPGPDAGESRHHLHDQYMNSFGLLWWGSLGLLLIGIFGIKSMYRPAKTDDQ